MPNVVKHTMKYQEQRRTLYLNLHEKDNYGRHRGQVLYGMELSPVGRTVVIRPGAIFTPYGTKFYWDVVNASVPGSNVVDIETVQVGGLGVFDTDNSVLNKRPLYVAVIARVAPTDPSRQPEIEDEADLSATTIEFTARVVAYSQATGTVTHELTPYNPVDMDAVQTQPAESYDLIRTWDAYPNANVVDTAGTIASESLQVNEVLLGLIIIGADPATDTPATTLDDGGGGWAAGIAYVPMRNAWQALADVLGFDPLLNLSIDETVGTPDSPNPALSQLATGFDNGNGVSVPLTMHPRFGTTVPTGTSTPWAGNWDAYRVPSFLRDGDNLLWNLKRLDYFLRLWMDRTGDQTLINLIQDGVGANLDRFASLDQILLEFQGNEADNQNAITWPDNQPGASSAAPNHALKSGVIPHSILGLNVLSTGFGDNHLNAISALAWSNWHLLNDVLGFGLDGRTAITRDDLRSTAAWTRSGIAGLQHTADGPLGALPSAGTAADDRPTIAGAAGASAYLTNESIYRSMEILFQRINQSGANLLRNSNFVAGDNNSDADGDIPDWTLSGGTWTRTNLVSALNLKQVELGLPALGELSQRLSDTDLADIVQDGTLMSAGITIEVTAGEVELTIVGRDNGLTELFRVTSSTLTATGGLIPHTFLFKVADAAGLEHIDFVIRETDNAVATVRIGGTWLGIGSGPENPALPGIEYNFLNRGGGEATAMRGDLYLGDNELKLGSTAAQAVFADRPHAVNAVEAKPTYAAAFTDPHLIDSAGAVAALQDLLERSSTRRSVDLVHNGQFELGAIDGTVVNTADVIAPSGWAWDGAHTNTTWSSQASGLYLYEQMLRITTWDDGMALTQVIENATADDGSARLAGHKMWSTAMAFKGSVGEDVQLVVIGLDNADVELGRATKDITCSGEEQMVSLSFTWDDGASDVDKFEIRVVNNEGGEIAVFDLYAVWMGPGLPPSDIRKNDAGVYVTRSPRYSMLGNLDFGGHRVTNAGVSIDPNDYITKGEVDALVGDKASIDYLRTSTTSFIDDTYLSWNNRTNVNHADDSVSFTAPKDAWYLVDSRVVASGFGVLCVVRIGGTDIAAFSTWGGPNDGYEPGVTIVDTAFLGDANGILNINASGPDHDHFNFDAIIFLTTGQQLRWRCLDDSGDLFVSGWFRVDQVTI